MDYQSDIHETVPSSEDEDMVFPERYTWPATVHGSCVAPLEGDVVNGCLKLYRKACGDISSGSIFITIDEKIGVPPGEHTYLISAIVADREARFGTSFKDGAYPAGISYYIRGYHDNNANTSDDETPPAFSAVIDFSVRN